MDQKTRIGLGVIAVILLLTGGATWWFYQGRMNTEKISVEAFLQDPFTGLSVPSGLDAATTAVYEEKISLTKEMYQKSPNIWETWVAIGNLHAFFGNNEKALLGYQQSVTLQSNNIVAERNIAALYAETLHDYEKAEIHYRAAIKNEVNNSELYSNLVKIEWQKLNKMAEAEEVLQDGLNRTNHNYELVALAVEFYQAKGDTDKAAMYAAELKTIKPSTKPVPAILGIPGR